MKRGLFFPIASIVVLSSVGAEELSVLDLKKASELLSEVHSFARSAEFSGAFTIDSRHHQFWELQSPYSAKRLRLWEQWRSDQARRPENANILSWLTLVRHPAFRNTQRLVELLKVGFTEDAFRMYAGNTLQPHIYTPELRQAMEQHKFAKESFDAFDRCEQETLSGKREVPKKTEKSSYDIRLTRLENLKVNVELEQMLDGVKSVYGQVRIDEESNTVIFWDRAQNMVVIEELLQSMDQFAKTLKSK